MVQRLSLKGRNGKNTEYRPVFCEQISVVHSRGHGAIEWDIANTIKEFMEMVLFKIGRIGSNGVRSMFFRTSHTGLVNENKTIEREVTWRRFKT